MAGEDCIELKFRLSDGTDIGPSKYSQSMTVSSLKEKIISQWPKGIHFHSFLSSQTHLIASLVSCFYLSIGV